MRRKFIGALLFGALLVAPTSTFVSCSDYDDEIANLQAQIDANKTEVGTLVSDKITAVEAVIANLEAADAAIEAQLADLEEADAATMAAAQSLVQAAAQELMDSMQAVVAMVQGNAASIEALVAADAKLQTAIETAQAKADAAYTLAQAADAKAQEALATLATVKADLEAQITALDAKLVKELENLAKVDAAVAAQIAALEKAGEAVNVELAKLAQAIADQKVALEKAIETAVAGVQANLNTEVAGLKVSIADVTTAYKAAVEGVKTELNAVKVALQGEIKTQVDALTAKMDILAMLLRAELKSLVFEPEFYYHGIEAFDAGTFNYNALKTYEVNADGNFATDAPYAHLDANGVQIWKNMIPALTAVYHLNPSNAAIDTEDMSKFNFIVLDRNYVKSSTTISPVIYKAVVSTDGKLTVKANFSDAEKIKTLDPTTGVGQVTVLALQYNKGAGAEADTVITSDYAALKANAYSNFVLNHLDADYGHIHLYTTAEAAINNPAQHSIEYNSAGLDLNTLFNTHYDIAGGATDTKWDDSAASKQVEADGFKYSYDLVGYYKGGNTTSETAHFGFKDGCWVRPQMVDDNGKQQAWGAKQNKATVGREPLVRVTLTDTLNNLIVAVGYLKFQITERPADAAIETVEFGPYNQPYTVTCVDEVFSEQLAWYEVENKILALLNISKADFEANYTLDQLSGATSGWLNATLYKTNKVDSDKYTTGRGKVEQSNYDAQSTMTEILKWTVSNNEAYEWFVTQGNTSMDVYIRYKHKSLNEYVCVKFTWTPSAINKTPSASINNDDKISNYWYAHNSMAEGFDDVHINTEVPGQVDANCEIKTDLKNTFVQNKFGALHYDALYTDLFTNAQTTVKAVFVQDDALYTNVPGAKFAHEAARSYNLAVSADGSQLLVRGTTEVVATITPAGVIEVNNASAAAKSMLNYAGHNELGEKQTLTVKVGFAYTYCSPVQKNIVTITNNTFFVKILRPVDTTEGEAAFIDATTNESSAPVKFEFQDWRDHKFVDNDINGSNYYAYYGFDSNINGVTCIEPLMDQITTDMNGGDINSTKLNAITNNVRFTYVWRPGADNFISKHYFGELVYLNNGNTVKDFNIRIPVKIHYTWGTIYTYINASVDNTISNANKK